MLSKKIKAVIRMNLSLITWMLCVEVLLRLDELEQITFSRKND